MDALVAMGTSICIWSILRHKTQMSTWLAKLGHQLASSSYTLYAVHFPLAALTAAIVMQYFGRTLPGDVLDPWAWAVYVGFLVVLGGMCFALSLVTERKHHLLKKWLARFI